MIGAERVAKYLFPLFLMPIAGQAMAVESGE